MIEDEEVEAGLEIKGVYQQAVQMRALHGEAKDEHHEDKITLSAAMLSATAGETENREEKGGKDNLNLKANMAMRKSAETFLEAKNLPPEETTTEVMIALAREETRQMRAVIGSFHGKDLEQESPNRDNLLESTAQILQDPHPPTQAGTGAVELEPQEAIISEIDVRQEVVIETEGNQHPRKITSTTELTKGLVRQFEQKTIRSLQAGQGLPILENPMAPSQLDRLDSPIYEKKNPKWKAELKSRERKELHGITQHRNKKNEKQRRKNEKKKRK